MSDDLTCVLLSWRKRRRNYRLLFGQPWREARLDWQRRLAVFRPGDVFAYERWEGNKYGTQHWSITILKAARAGDTLGCFQGVRPGAHLLCYRHGKEACKSLLSLFDLIRKDMPIEAIEPDQWSLVGHRLTAKISHQIILDRLKTASC